MEVAKQVDRKGMLPDEFISARWVRSIQVSEDGTDSAPAGSTF